MRVCFVKLSFKLVNLFGIVRIRCCTLLRCFLFENLVIVLRVQLNYVVLGRTNLDLGKNYYMIVVIEFFFILFLSFLFLCFLFFQFFFRFFLFFQIFYRNNGMSQTLKIFPIIPNFRRFDSNCPQKRSDLLESHVRDTKVLRLQFIVLF